MCSRVLPFNSSKLIHHCFLCKEPYSDVAELHKHRLSHIGETASDSLVLEHQKLCIAAVTKALSNLEQSCAKAGDRNGAALHCYRAGMYIGETTVQPYHPFYNLMSNHDMPGTRADILKATSVVRRWREMMDTFKSERKQSLKQKLGKMKRKRKKVFLCRTCKRPFSHATALHLHAVNVHCQKLFPSNGEKTLTRGCIKHALNNVPCRGCKKIHKPSHSKTASKKKTKTSEATQDMNVSCKICHRTFAKQTGLNGHMKVHSSKSNPFCSMCHKGFPHNNKRCRHVIKSYTCNLCQEIFVERNAYRRHMRYHSNNRPWECNFCTKRFSQSAHLRTHIRWHRGEKPFKCPYCDRRFSQSGHLNEHKRLHTGERPFVCDVCGNKYHLSSSLRSHRRVHTGERPYQCSVCFHTFSQSSSLKVHMKGHHGSQSYSCKVCGKGFLSNGSLATHTRVHSNEHGFHCRICGRNFATAAALQTHTCFHRK